MRRAAVGIAIACTFSVLTLAPLVNPPPVLAAGCVRFVASNFDGPGNDNNYPNGEWVRIKNVCATRRNISSWVIHDYHRNHVYHFPSSFHIGAGVSVTLYSGHGDNTRRKRYWGYSAAVWNNSPPEWAYLRKADGTLKSKWTEY